jgi:hypothetical protein
MNVLIRLAYSAIGALLLIGCANRQQFRLVDISSGNAIPDARVVVRDGGSFSYFYRSSHVYEAGKTDTNGVVERTGLNKNRTIYFQAGGYRGLTAGLVGNGQIAVRPTSVENADLMHLDQEVVDDSEIIVIRMTPTPSQ